MCIQNKTDKSQYSLVTFGNDWNYESGVDQWFTTNEGSDLFKFAEIAMIQDLTIMPNWK